MMTQNNLTKVENGLRTEIQSSEDKLRTEIRTSENGIRTDLSKLEIKIETVRTDLSKRMDRIEQKIENTNQETRRFMGILHEETLHKLDLVLEGFQPFTEKVENHGRQIENLENRVTVIEMIVKSK